MSLSERLEQLDQRERRLLGLLGLVTVLMVALGVPLGVSGWLGDARAENARLREAVDSIQGARRLLARRQQIRDQERLRYATPAPPLAAYLGDKARAVGVELPEIQDRPVLPHGKRFEERSTRVTLRKVGMLRLLTFLESLVKGPYPVAVTRLSIKRRSGETDSWDVEVVLSAFDRKPEASKAADDREAQEAAP